MKHNRILAALNGFTSGILVSSLIDAGTIAAPPSDWLFPAFLLPLTFFLTMYHIFKDD